MSGEVSPIPVKKGIPMRVAREIMEAFEVDGVLIVYKKPGMVGATIHEKTAAGRHGELKFISTDQELAELVRGFLRRGII